MPMTATPGAPTMKIYRCLRPSCMETNAGVFWCAPKTKQDLKCPQCGLDASHPKFGDKIIRLAIVHFDPPTEFEGRGHGHRACDPSKSICAVIARDPVTGESSCHHVGSGDVRQINCPDCIESAAFKDAMAIGINSDGESVPSTDVKLSAGAKAGLERIQPLARFSKG